MHLPLAELGDWLTIPVALSLAYIALEVVGIIFAADAVMHGRTPQGTIAWVAALVAFPLVAVPAYLLFGARRIAGYVRARRRGVGKLTELAGRVHDALSPFREATPGVLDPAKADVLALLPVTGANALELLIDGAATFDAIFRAIDGAKRTIAVQFYIVRDDHIGRALADRLLAARARGVRVWFLYDSIGSSKLPRAYTARLRDAGVEVEDFRPSRAPRFKVQLNFRNHRKTVVVDGAVAFIGGHNVGDEYLGKNDAIGPWRDTHVAIRGPAALAAQLAFVEDWYCCTRSLPDLPWTPIPAAPSLPAPAGPHGRVAVIPSGPADELETALFLVLQLIHASRARLWIATPYFVPDEAVTAALQAAALRGVDVRVLLPRRSDNRLVDLAARAAVDELFAAEVSVFEHGVRGMKGSRGGFMHQKVLLADGAAAVGSANMDNRSFRINFEITAVSNDADFVSSVEVMLMKDFAGSARLTREDLRRGGWPARLVRRIARLFGPIL